MGDHKERVHFPQDWVTLGDWMGKLGPPVITGHHGSVLPGHFHLDA